MGEYLKGKNVRLRCKKSYRGAHSHVIIGRVEEENDRYIAILGRSFHFVRIVDGLKSQVASGRTAIRIIPWDNVELIHWLGENVSWEADYDFDTNGDLILKDPGRTMIAEHRDVMD